MAKLWMDPRPSRSLGITVIAEVVEVTVHLVVVVVAIQEVGAEVSLYSITRCSLDIG